MDYQELKKEQPIIKDKIESGVRYIIDLVLEKNGNCDFYTPPAERCKIVNNTFEKVAAPKLLKCMNEIIEECNQIKIN